MTDQISAPEFLDLTAFYLAVSSVDKILVQSSESPVPGVDSDLLRKHRGEAGALIRRVASSVDAGIDSLLRDASEKSKLRVKTKLDAALRGSSFSAYAVRAEFLEFFLPRLQTHTNVLRDVFGDKSSQAIRIVQSASVDAPLPRLYKLAGVQMASGGKLPLLKKWIQEATKICGNPVSDIEEISVDIQTTDVLLDRVTKNNRKLDLLDPTDPAAAEVTQENAQLLNKVTRLAEKSGDPASIKAHAAARVAKSGEDKGSFATTISAHLKMTPEQEDSMLARGKVVIAAGAGSGKTRVLAGKVIHHCQDLGLSLSNVMAVSFTIKSSSELKKRIVDYGQEIGLNLPNPDSDRKSFAGIGTTHSIGRRILKSANSGWKTDDPKKDTIQGGDISKLLKVAILQVKMRSQGGASAMPPASAMSFFPNRPSSSAIQSDPALESTSPIQDPLEGKSPLELFLQDDGRYQTMIAAAVDTIRDLLSSFPSVKVFPASASGWCRAEVFGPGIVRFGDTLADMRVNGAALSYKDADPRYRAPDRFVAFSKREFDRQAVVDDIRNALGFPQAENALQALVELSTKKPSELSANELAILEEIVTNPFVASGLTQRKVLVRTAAVTPLLFKKLAIAEDEDVTSDLLGNMETSEKGIQTASQRKMEKLDYDQSPYYWFIHNPANQWFNIGATDADFQEEDAKGNKKDISVGEFARFVGFNKNSLRAPGEIFMGSQTKSVPVGEDDDDVNWSDTGAAKDRIFSAVYGAYEWLKGNIPTLQGRLDYDDQLVQPSRELIENPELLKKYQKQYKCVLVDEAQDLNAAQHLLFGLVSGYIDPATLKPREDGKISADTFALIGDDKQCIYEFRAADPSKFIEKSDLVPGGEGFTTKLLDTNFRSGNVIVESANKLIAYNSKQIPMVCKTDPARGEGTISRMSVPTMDDAAESMCSQILSEFEVAKQDGDADNFYGNYGLAVRTNQEVYQFAMKMIEKGIPFRSKKNFLSGPAIGPVIGIFSILRTDSLEARNAGVIAGLNAPDFGANPNTVNTKMQELGVTDYYDFLVNQNGARKIYKLSKMVSALEQYAEYIEEVVRVGEKGTATDVLDLILNQSGPGGDTFVDSLSASLMDDAEAMEELQAKADADATGSGKITPMMLATYALAPIEPLRKAALRFPTAKEFVGYIRSLIESNKKNVGDGDAKADAVQIDTVHGWKGLEVANLYVPMWDGGFPHKRSMASPSLMESERRLAYVAITRGRERVTILEPKSVKDKDVEPSQFTYEACIPLVGTNNGRGPVGREPGVDDEETPIDLKTASVDRFRIPVMEPRSGSYHQDEDVVSEPVSDDLEKVWDAVPYEGLVK